MLSSNSFIRTWWYLLPHQRHMDALWSGASRSHSLIAIRHHELEYLRVCAPIEDPLAGTTGTKRVARAPADCPRLVGHVGAERVRRVTHHRHGQLGTTGDRHGVGDVLDLQKRAHGALHLGVEADGRGVDEDGVR